MTLTEYCQKQVLWIDKNAFREVKQFLQYCWKCAIRYCFLAQLELLELIYTGVDKRSRKLMLENTVDNILIGFTLHAANILEFTFHSNKSHLGNKVKN